VHEIDFMLRILGPAVEVSAAGRHFFNEECDYEDFLTAHITFANGAIGSITSAQCDFLGKSSAEIYLDKGSIYYDSVTQRAQFVQEGGKKEDIPFGEIHPEWENGVYREMREFAEVCLGESPVTIPGEEGMRAVEICQACYRSLREHRAVKLPLPR
jgi:predicted dehydrogenase